jgi:hypothetical protein
MQTGLHPWQMLLLILAGWINRQQQNAIEYLMAENRILRECAHRAIHEIHKGGEP